MVVIFVTYTVERRRQLVQSQLQLYFRIISVYRCYTLRLGMLGLRIAIVVVCWGISQGLNNIQTTSSCSSRAIDITDARGRITSPNYPANYSPNQDCKWRITSSNGIRLTLEALDNADQFLQGKNCDDHLQFATIGKDGVSTYFATEKELCADDISEITKTVYTVRKGSEDKVTVEISFASDYSSEGKGFSLYFETMCNETIDGTSGIITSPNYPENYPNLADCFTEIRGPRGSYIEIQFTTMQFNNLQNCESDYVQINAGPPGAYGVSRTRYCDESTELVQTAYSTVTLNLVTDNWSTNKGFSATWRAVFPTTAASTTTPVPEATTAASTTATTTKAETTTSEIIPDVIENCKYTINGFICQRWDVDSPHVPKILPKENDRDHNFCRITAAGSKRPWCYTTDPRMEYEYCNVSNCVKPTTVSPPDTLQLTTTPETASVTGTKNGSSLGRKDETSATQHSPVVWYPILAALALLFIICIGLFFWCKGRKKKDAARITESATSDAVSFHRFAEDEYRPRENTYVEIPFLEEVREDHATRVNREGRHEPNGKGFVMLDSASGSRNSSTPSIDSILAAKEAARQNFERGASTSHDVNAYSVAEDVHHTQAGPSLPRQRESTCRSQSATEQQSNLQNVYQAIDTQADASNETEYNLPTSSHSIRSSTESSDLQEQLNRKRGFWKKNSKNKQRTINGFSNPIYRKESSVDSDSLGRNPFDSDEQDSAVESPTHRLQSTSLQNDESTEYDNVANVYNAPSVIPQVTETDSYHPDLRVALDTTESPDSPYMMPKLSRNDKIPADAAMISISPNMIDDTDHMTYDRHQNLRSVTNPTSPIFDLSQDFTYDAPQQRKTTQSFTSVKSDTSYNTENSGFFSNQRDSGNASLSTAGQDDDKSHEYCIMGELDKSTSTLTSTLDPNDVNFQNSNRVSQLYLSMRGFEEDGRTVSESSVTGPSEIGRTNL